jgi:uncharacterized protein YggU (UPF0235/DUF167 family)
VVFFVSSILTCRVFFFAKRNALILFIKVKPNSRVNEILADADKNSIVKIVAIPQDRKGNEALITFFSKKFHIPKSKIKIISRLINQNKRIEFRDKFAKNIYSVLKK